MPDAPGSAEIEAALRLVRNWAKAGILRYGRRATDDALALGFGPNDICDVLEDVKAGCVHKIEPDHHFADRTVIVLRLNPRELDLYVKLSMRIDIDHDVLLASFHRWGA